MPDFDQLDQLATLPDFLEVSRVRLRHQQRRQAQGRRVDAGDLAALGHLALAFGNNLAAGGLEVAAEPLATGLALALEAVDKADAALRSGSTRQVSQAASCLAHAGVDLIHLAAALGALPIPAPILRS